MQIIFLFVDPSSRALRSQAAEPCKENGNKWTVQAYLNMNWYKIIGKEKSSKNYQHNIIYGKSLYYFNNKKYI